jgi:catechol 2,3-dioxygenase-like lactoylglutathione lyase family enzyme
MIDGVHVLLYSSRAEAVREFLRDTLGLTLADPTPEWPILALPPSEIAVHPTDGAAHAEVYLMTRDLDVTLRELRAKGVIVVREPEEQRWGRASAIQLPDGSELPIYEPRHASVLDRPPV